MLWNKPRTIEILPTRIEQVQEESRDTQTGRRLNKRTERQENGTVAILAKRRGFHWKKTIQKHCRDQVRPRLAGA